MVDQFIIRIRHLQSCDGLIHHQDPNPMVDQFIIRIWHRQSCTSSKFGVHKILQLGLAEQRALAGQRAH